MRAQATRTHRLSPLTCAFVVGAAGSNRRPPACRYDADGSQRTTTNDYGRSETLLGRQRTTTNGSDRAINARWIGSADAPPAGQGKDLAGFGRERTRV